MIQLNTAVARNMQLGHELVVAYTQFNVMLLFD